MTRLLVPLLIVLCVLFGLSTHMVVNCGDEDDPEESRDRQRRLKHRGRRYRCD